MIKIISYTGRLFKGGFLIIIRQRLHLRNDSIKTWYNYTATACMVEKWRTFVINLLMLAFILELILGKYVDFL